MKSPLLPVIVVLMVLTASCSEYNKLLKSDDSEKKYTKALEYYEEGECIKSMSLLEGLIPESRGQKRSESVYYYYSKSVYCIKDYILAGYYFDNFAKTFPNSQYTEECEFLSVMCKINESPEYSLDQGPTVEALDNMQLFLNKYPQTQNKDTLNYFVKQLRSKLELKSFESAKLYHQTRRYKSAVIALENALTEFPDSRYSEEMHFLLLESHFELATNSIERKKLERLKAAMKSYRTFVDTFPSSSNLDRAKAFSEQIQDELKAYN